MEISDSIVNQTAGDVAHLFLVEEMCWIWCIQFAFCSFMGVFGCLAPDCIAGSYPRRTNSLGKWTLFWLAQPFLNMWSGKWAYLLYHQSKRCDKRLFSSIFMVKWLIINVAVVECRKPGWKPSSLTYRNMPQNALSLLDNSINIHHFGMWQVDWLSWMSWLHSGTKFAPWS